MEQYENGVMTTFVDIDTTVATLHAVGGQGQHLIPIVHHPEIERTLDDRVAPTGAADHEDALILRIQIDQDGAGKQGGVHTEHPGQTGLFIHGEEQFKGWVHQGLIRGRRHGQSQGDPVIRCTPH